MSAVSVSESGVRPILADAVDLARRALLELEPAGVGAHLGVAAEGESAATHRFEATLPGYRGWQWAVVVAAAPEAEYATVSESALLPGPDALVAPAFVPWEQRIRPGDLAPGDLLAPPADDPRLLPGYVATGDPVVDEVAYTVGLGRAKVMSREGRAEAAERWYAERGPDSEMAKAAPSTCGMCGFYLPLAGALRAAFGVCGNAMGADGLVVHVAYGCGAHSDTILPGGGGSPIYQAYDDDAVEMIARQSDRVLPASEGSTAPSEIVTAVSTPAGDDSEQITGDAKVGAASAADPAAAGDIATGLAEPTANSAPTSGAPQRSDAVTGGDREPVSENAESAPVAAHLAVTESATGESGTSRSNTAGLDIDGPGAAAASVPPGDAAHPTGPESVTDETADAEPAGTGGPVAAGSAGEQAVHDESDSAARPEFPSSPRS
ncbi:DUF3027 domain-containing protein [Nocardia sp. NPDC049220]|uniref:DUF3027 domain-containing protein n=1 Tax=Nocardia sp. NPDC049220 TaxID=3155273 RepID=UPI0033C4D516